MTWLACGALSLALFLYVFYDGFFPGRQIAVQRVKTRLDFLVEQKAVLYDNLRDLNFEYRAGKYPEEDYAAQRATLEAEAAQVLEEMGRLEARRR
jgi:hypothetical protein